MAKNEKEVPLKGAPYWYGTHLDDLDFEWSREEELEIERYCEKILKNIKEEEMTPLERWNATWTGEPRDRLMIFLYTLNVYASRTLDSGADAVLPIDVFRNPKLYVKAHLASVARFKMDFPCIHSISYAEDLWGGDALMIDYGTPCGEGPRPIKTLEDAEALEAPDPKSAGLFPGYLWTQREMRRIFDKYGLSEVMPIFSHTCCGPAFTVSLGMMEWIDFVMGLRKKSDVCKRCIEVGTEWNIKVGEALLELAQPQGINSCQFTGGYPLKGNEWVADSWKKFGDALAPRTIMSWGYSSFHRIFEWFDVLYERGVMSTDCWNGGSGGHGEADYKKVIDWHRDHDLYLSWAPDEHVLMSGPTSAIEEQFKEYCEYGKPHRKFAQGIGAVSYWTPQHHVDAAVNAAKKYGRY